MSISIYNTMTRQKEKFEPLHPGKVTMYVCGPTVWSYIHIGNARTFLFFDVVRRYLQFRGYEVIYVENFTDVDDKLIRKAQELGWSVPQVAEHFIQAYQEDTGKLGIQPADVHPRVTEHMEEIIDFIRRLVDKGHAYEADGDVYFRVKSFSDYGRLSQQSIEDLRSGARVEVDEAKEDPLDFALWKKAKPGEIAWDSPWGRGRPGWHIECSAMSMKYLGETLDIHAGGVDLTFPHHENERAQSESLTGKPFARYWMHTGHLTVEDEKMSKSLGNVTNLRQLLQDFRPEVIRLFMLSTYYRHPIQFSVEALKQATAGMERIETTLRNIRHYLESAPADQADGQPNRHMGEQLESLRERFFSSMDDDFHTANAIAVVFDTVREANRFLAASAGSKSDWQRWLEELSTWCEILGILPQQDDLLLDEEIEEWIRQRQEARARKDWETSDRIREMLMEKGILLEDTPQGVRWRRI